LLPSILAYHLRIRPPEYFVKVDKSVAFTTQYGIKLVSDLYRPQRVKKTATILIRIPYTKNIQARFFSNVVGRLWAERGYTVVIQGTRGRYESEGRHVPFQKERVDVFVYTSPILEEDIEVTGNIKVILYISTTSTNTDFTVKLVDVHTNGNDYNVSEGILRQDYKPSDFPVKIEIDLWPTSIVFFKGHRIRLEISSSNYPRFDRNQNTGREIYQETKTVTAIQKVYHGPESPSELILPIIPK